ncbi:radical SAM protein [Campylobacter sp. MIT 99-7217]|uniref:radical SAM/SPASM domain-containing protein n=1 Tax=Campylobacter sp. MIT 99-7217 TaxID=535091 RepID=UPI0011579385|nr:SPASM domain-containing protein [Campylobacter sp. MIT 99-7217]TQR29149.1 radical SAM protein [Campylobacter sp. MIT 99-7217]
MRGLSLTFVPNSYCNFACSYCYLGKLTNRKEKTQDMAEQFKKIAATLKEQKVIIKDIMLHGAELTASDLNDVKELLKAINEYKKDNLDYIKFFNKLSPAKHFIHLKTNLYNLDKFFDTFVLNEVGISGSVDLPLKMHEKNRILKNGNSTLEKTLKMIELLSTYPHFKQFSATMTSEYLDADEFLQDIFRLEKLGFDMANNFYIMFAYQSKNANASFKMAEDKKMLEFYKALRQRLKNTKYAFAVEHIWFKEFLGGYCTNCTNCADGDRMLIQKNGNAFICHRSQAVASLRSGNVFKQDFESIRARAVANIRILENSLNLSKDCLECEYFHLCKASCSIERKDTGLGKSYTCALQKEIYKNNPEIYKPNKVLAKESLDEFLRQNQIEKLKEHRMPNISFELKESKNSLENIIKQDEILSQIYDRSNFYLSINDKLNELDFEKDDIYSLKRLSKNDEIKLFIKKQSLFINSKESIDNFVHLMLLGGKAQIYGDEKRQKIPHIASKQLYFSKLENEALNVNGYYVLDISDFLRANAKNYEKDSRNFLFFTTKAMREYHYEKHAKNAFYHIQAINLPFARLEFIWEE